jgi:hypothetical protein
LLSVVVLLAVTLGTQWIFRFLHAPNESPSSPEAIKKISLYSDNRGPAQKAKLRRGAGLADRTFLEQAHAIRQRKREIDPLRYP